MSATGAPARRGHAAVSRGWEARSAQVDARFVKAARQRWQALPADHQMQLARCLADCQRAEFTLRHKQVVAVTAGLKRSADAAGDEYLHNRPCLVFVVRRKLTPEQLAKKPGQVLPTEVLVPAWVEGAVQAVAVPTDVQGQRRLLAGRSQADTSFSVGAQGARGSVAWTIVPDGGEPLVVSALHVLSPAPQLDGMGLRAGTSAQALNATGSATVGPNALRASGFGGRVVPGPARSFDVQLAEVLDSKRVRAAFDGLRLSPQLPWVRSEIELDRLLALGHRLEIHVPGNNPRRQNPGQVPLLAERSLVEQDLNLNYDFADGSRRPILHRVIELQVRFGEKTLPGDSGCPVLVASDDKPPSFAGMHIAGDEIRGTSYIIPAWHIIGPGAYEDVGGQMPPGPWRLPAKV